MVGGWTGCGLDWGRWMQFVVGRASAVRRCIFVLGEEELYCSIADLEVAFGKVHWGRRVGPAWGGGCMVWVVLKMVAVCGGLVGL